MNLLVCLLQHVVGCYGNVARALVCGTAQRASATHGERWAWRQTLPHVDAPPRACDVAEEEAAASSTLEPWAVVVPSYRLAGLPLFAPPVGLLEGACSLGANFALLLLLFELVLNVLCMWCPTLATALPMVCRSLPMPLPQAMLDYLFPGGARGATNLLVNTSAASSFGSLLRGEAR